MPVAKTIAVITNTSLPNHTMSTGAMPHTAPVTAISANNHCVRRRNASAPPAWVQPTTHQRSPSTTSNVSHQIHVS